MASGQSLINVFDQPWKPVVLKTFFSLFTFPRTQLKWAKLKKPYDGNAVMSAPPKMGNRELGNKECGEESKTPAETSAWGDKQNFQQKRKYEIALR